MKQSRTALIVGIVALVLGKIVGILLYMSMGSGLGVTNADRSVLVWAGRLMLLPGTFLMIAAYLIRRYPARSRLYWWLVGSSAAITSGLIVGLPMIMIVMAFSFSSAPDTDLSHYPEMRRLNSLGEEALMAHFPKTIPPGARNVQFNASPGILQGGSTCHLQFIVPEPYIRNELGKYLPRAKQVQHGSHSSWGENEIPTTSFEGWPDSNLPVDFTVIVLKAHPYHPRDWNHGYSTGVAGSLERRTMIYWAEDW